MCRYAEDAGATLGAIVDAMAHEAKSQAFCLSTDATGVAIQPTYIGDGKRQPCRKGHFFVVLADADHVFFEYQAKHTSAAVSEMFRGFRGYIQADANAVYDALFRGRPSPTLWQEEPEEPPPKEVGCWSHCRRNFWDAAVCKHAEGVTGLRIIDALFAADAPLWKLPPAKRQQERIKCLAPMLDAIFNWVRDEARTQRPRGLVSKALGYALRQEAPLRRFLDDPRLKLHKIDASYCTSYMVSDRAWRTGSDSMGVESGLLHSGVTPRIVVHVLVLVIDQPTLDQTTLPPAFNAPVGDVKLLGEFVDREQTGVMQAFPVALETIGCPDEGYACGCHGYAAA
jgi:hypothetical protein